MIDLDRPEEARESLRQAHEVAQDTEARRIGWQILATWANLESQIGNEAEAQALGVKAAEVIHYIAGHIDDEPLRNSFLSRPEVRSVLAR